MPNIVQLECFHTPMAGTLETFVRNMRERIEDGASIKTVVRFFDQRGKVCPAVERAMSAMVRAEAHEGAMWEQLCTMRGWRRQWLIWRAAWSSRRSNAAMRRAKKVAKDEFLLVMNETRVFGIQQHDYCFRPVMPNEMHDLSEAVHAATNTWIFVFAADKNLLTDKVNLLGSIMD